MESTKGLSRSIALGLEFSLDVLLWISSDGAVNYRAFTYLTIINLGRLGQGIKVRRRKFTSTAQTLLATAFKG